jgi:hypothetical protein
MQGATPARFVVCDLEILMKLFMMPQTVPNRPTKGDVAPMVASRPAPSHPSRFRAGYLGETRRCAFLDTIVGGDSRRQPRFTQRGGRNVAKNLRLDPGATRASAIDRTSAMAWSARPRRRCAEIVQ